MDALVALLVVAAFYVIIARRSGGATVGEALLHTSYAIEQRSPIRSRSPLETVRALCPAIAMSSPRPRSCSGLWGDPERLRIVTQLLEKPLTLADMAPSMQQLPFELRHQLDRLTSTGALTVSGDEPDAVYAVRPELARALVQSWRCSRPSRPMAPAPMTTPRARSATNGRRAGPGSATDRTSAPWWR